MTLDDVTALLEADFVTIRDEMLVQCREDFENKGVYATTVPGSETSEGLLLAAMYAGSNGAGSPGCILYLWTPSALSDGFTYKRYYPLAYQFTAPLAGDTGWLVMEDHDDDA